MAQRIGHGALVQTADVTDKPSLIAAFASVADQFGGSDVLGANAGIFPQARLETKTEAKCDLVSDTSLKGSFLPVQAAIPYLKHSDQGRIVLTSSITGPVTGFPGWTHDAASKAGQPGFMRTTCLELAHFGITINAVLPGDIMTEAMAGMGPEYHAAMTTSTPMGKQGVVADIGQAARYFPSPEAGYVTGQTIIVDGEQILPESLGPSHRPKSCRPHSHSVTVRSDRSAAA